MSKDGLAISGETSTDGGKTWAKAYDRDPARTRSDQAGVRRAEAHQGRRPSRYRNTPRSPAQPVVRRVWVALEESGSVQLACVLHTGPAWVQHVICGAAQPGGPMCRWRWRCRLPLPSPATPSPRPSRGPPVHRPAGARNPTRPQAASNRDPRTRRCTLSTVTTCYPHGRVRVPRQLPTT